MLWYMPVIQILGRQEDCKFRLGLLIDPMSYKKKKEGKKVEHRLFSIYKTIGLADQFSASRLSNQEILSTLRASPAHGATPPG